jgi:hypothetical protein
VEQEEPGEVSLEEELVGVENVGREEHKDFGRHV